MAAGRVRNPKRNVARATVLGTVGCAIVYILGTVTVFGTVSNAALRTSTAPFSVRRADQVHRLRLQRGPGQAFGG